MTKGESAERVKAETVASELRAQATALEVEKAAALQHHGRYKAELAAALQAREHATVAHRVIEADTNRCYQAAVASAGKANTAASVMRARNVALCTELENKFMGFVNARRHLSFATTER